MTAYMNVWNELEAVASHVKLHETGDPTLIAKAAQLLLPGWDYTLDIDRLDPPRFGVWRAAHLNILMDECESPGPAILAVDMNVDQIASGLWRQLRIHPDCCPVHSVSEGDPFHVSANPDVERGEGRDVFIRSLIGHTVRDAAEYLVDLLRREPELGRLVLAKDLKGALTRSPQLIDDKWPAVTRKRWKRTNQGLDLIPPIYFLALLYELARLAQNHAALLSLSFDCYGNEVSVADLKRELSSLDKMQKPSLLADRLMKLASLQTTAAIPPQTLLEGLAPAKQFRWIRNRLDRLHQGFNEYGKPFADRLFDTMPKEQPARVARKVSNHSFLQPQKRAGQGESLRKDLAATYWSLNWRNHAAVGLIMIAEQARAWNREFRDARSGPVNLNRASSLTGRDHSLDQAAATIAHFWLESYSMGALRTALRPVIEGKLRAERDKGLRFTDPSTVDRLVNEAAEELDVLAMHSKFGGKFCQAARSVMHRLPPAGAEGYTALYHPHLWLNRHGDDLSHYAARVSREPKRGTPAYIKHGMVGRAHYAGAGGHFRNSLVPLTKAPDSNVDRHIAVRAAQCLAMTVSSSALEPMRAVLRRERQNKNRSED